MPAQTAHTGDDEHAGLATDEGPGMHLRALSDVRERHRRCRWWREVAQFGRITWLICGASRWSSRGGSGWHVGSLADSRPGIKAGARDVELDAASVEIARLSETVKEMAVKLMLVEGKGGWG